jgi:hypothetical protein
VPLFAIELFHGTYELYKYNKRNLKAFGIGEVAGFNPVIIILSDSPKHQIRL